MAAVRPASQDDLPALVACIAAAFEPFRQTYTPEAFRDTVLSLDTARKRSKEMTLLVAEDTAAGVIGTIGYRVVSPGHGHLRGMAVMPEFQGSGVAERLLQAAERGLREAGCRRVTLASTRPLSRAVRFYLRRGYRATGAMRDFFGMPLFEYEKTWPEGERHLDRDATGPDA